MDDSPELNEQKYRIALRDLEMAIDNFSMARSLGLLSLDDMEVLNSVVDEKTKALNQASALLVVHPPIDKPE